VNLFSMRLLAGGKDANLNMKGAYLEAWSDMLGSLGVILGRWSSSSPAGCGSTPPWPS
jgi:Co/Zn/Cd efflux system component